VRKAEPERHGSAIENASPSAPPLVRADRFAASADESFLMKAAASLPSTARSRNKRYP
jgi:hypothetical protein